jgi:hypothetical protein
MGDGNESEIHDLIQFKGRVYEVPSAVLTGLIQTHPGIISSKMHQYGVKDVHGDNISGCGYCSHFDIANAGGTIEGEPGISVNHCGYRRIEDILWAKNQMNARPGKVVRLTLTPCALYDARVAALAEYGALDIYLVDKPFDAIPIIEAMGAPADLVAETFAIKPPERRATKTRATTIKPRKPNVLQKMIKMVTHIRH